MFRAHVLIIRRSKLLYTASGIITPIGGRLVHEILCFKLVKYSDKYTEMHGQQNVKKRARGLDQHKGRSVGLKGRQAGRHAIYSISTNIKSFLRWCIRLTFRPPGGTNSRGSACTKQLVKSHSRAERSICSDSLHWIATVCEHSIPVQLRKINSLAKRNGVL